MSLIPSGELKGEWNGRTEEDKCINESNSLRELKGYGEVTIGAGREYQ